MRAQRNGVLNANGGTVVKRFVPFLLGFSIDTEEGNRLCGFRAGKHKCRMCEGEAWNFNPLLINNERNSEVYQFYHRFGEAAWKKKMANLPLTPLEDQVFQHNTEFIVQNVNNPLHQHFLSTERNLFSSCPFDSLHTLLKWLNQRCIHLGCLSSKCAKKTISRSK